MGQKSDAERGKRHTHVVGAVSAGITKKVATLVERQVRGAFSADGKKVHLRGLRFIPSTRVDLDDGAFQILANAIVEVPGPAGTPGRPESVDSVITVGDEKARGQVLRTVKIPALAWTTAAGK